MSDSLNECRGYDTKPSDDEVTVMLKLYIFIAINRRSTQALNGSNW